MSRSKEDWLACSTVVQVMFRLVELGSMNSEVERIGSIGLSSQPSSRLAVKVSKSGMHLNRKCLDFLNSDPKLLTIRSKEEDSTKPGVHSNLARDSLKKSKSLEVLLLHC